MHPRRSLWQTLLPLLMFLLCALMQSACSCQSAKSVSTKASVCVPQHKKQPIASGLEKKKTVPGATAYSFAVDATGQPSMSVPLSVPPGRANMVPDLELRYEGPNHEGVAGNFDLMGASVISRCNKSSALDHEIAEPQFADDDAFCLDGVRLVLVTQNESLREFRTWPDKQIKVLEHLNDTGSSFTAYYPTGEVVDYGTTAGSRPSADGNILAWLAETRKDPRGNGIQFGYCFVEDEGNVKEFALDEVEFANRAISFHYSARENSRAVYENGLTLHRSLQLDAVKMAVNDQLTQQYDLTYEQSETTQRMLLVSIQECAGSGECQVPEFTDLGRAPGRNVEIKNLIVKMLAPTTALG